MPKLKSFALPGRADEVAEASLDFLPKVDGEGEAKMDADIFDQAKGDDYLKELLKSKSEAKYGREEAEADAPELKVVDKVEAKPVEKKEEEAKTFSPEYLALNARLEAQEQESRRDKEELQRKIDAKAAELQAAKVQQQSAPVVEADDDYEFAPARTVRALEKEVTELKQMKVKEDWNRAIGSQYQRMKSEAKAVMDSPDFADFATHFPEQHLNTVFDQIAKAGNWDYIRNVNWKQEFQAAYKAKTYDAVKKELSDLKAKQQSSIDKAKETKKENLRAVGKPSGGATASADRGPVIQSVVGTGRRNRDTGFDAISRQFKSALKSSRA